MLPVFINLHYSGPKRQKDEEKTGNKDKTTDEQTDSQKDRRRTGEKTHGQAKTETDRKTGSWTDKQLHGQAKTNRQIQTYRQRNKNTVPQILTEITMTKLQY